MASLFDKYPLSHMAAKENNFSDAELSIILKGMAGDAPDADVAVFLHICRRSGLDPLSNQIHLVVRRSNRGGPRGTVQTGIDGYRLIADRTGRYAGSSDPLFNDNLTQFMFASSDDKHPKTATVVVKKLVGELSNPTIGEFQATAMWDAYYPGTSQGYMWDKMPFLMLGKVAEALALRKAFPGELSGIYTNEEMDQADKAFEKPKKKTTTKKPDPERQYKNPNAVQLVKRLHNQAIDIDELESVLGFEIDQIEEGSEGNKVLTKIWHVAVEFGNGVPLAEAVKTVMENDDDTNDEE